MSAAPAQTLQRAVCQNHLHREAVARCPSCTQFFCRECITEFEGRMLCVTCFRARTEVKEKVKRDWFLPNVLVQSALGLGLIWLATWLFGRVLLSIPSSFHEGTLWEKVGF